MDSDQGKLFVGGISWETTEEKLKDYFGAFGEVVETVIMKERSTGRARGFGFVIFSDPAVADRVLLDKHTIDGRQVEAKRAVPRDEQQTVPRSNAAQAGLSSTKTKKIFVGGLASTVTEEEFKKYFEQFGTITDVVVMYDHNTQRPRGFGFITFDTEDAVEAVLTKSFHELNEKMVEVKKAIPKDQSGQGSGNVAGGRGGRGGYAGGYTGASVYGGRGGGGYGRDTGYGAGRGSYGQGGFASAYGGGYSSNVNGGFGSNSGGFGSTGYMSPNSYGAGAYASGTTVAYGSPSGGYGGAGYGSSSAGAGRNSWNAQTGSFASQSGSGGYNGASGGFASQPAWGSVAGGTGGNAGSGYGGGTYAYGTDSMYYGSGATGARNPNYSGSTSAASVYSIPAGGQSVGNYSTYGDMYGASAYGSDQWGTQPQSTPGSGYGNPSEVANGSGGYGGGYGATARQTQRSQDARFQPYPARTGDRSI